jgi:hypothetical protein
MNRKALVLLLVVAAAIVPASAGAKVGSQEELTMMLSPPLVFGDQTSDCAQGTATFTVDSTAGRGSGTVCFLTASPVTPCPKDACTTFTDALTFELPGGTFTISAVQSEVDSFDPASGNFTVELEFEGQVTQATRRFHKLVGDPFNGSGATVFASDGTVSPSVTFVIDT